MFNCRFFWLRRCKHTWRLSKIPFSRKTAILRQKYTLAKLSPSPKKICAACVGIYVAKKHGLDKGLPGICSPITLHSVASALKNSCFALDVGPCSPASASSDTSMPELYGLPWHLASRNLVVTSPQFRPPSFQGKAFFRQVLSKCSPNFRQTSP